MRTAYLSIPAVGLVLLSGVAVDAAEGREVTSYAECGPVKDDEIRLACFDALFRDGRFVIPDLEAIRKRDEKRQREAFGKSSAEIEEEQIEALPNRPRVKVDEVEMTVERIKRDQFGYTTFFMDNGQIWRQEGTARYPSRTPIKVTLKKGALGGFFMVSEDNGRSVKVRRQK